MMDVLFVGSCYRDIILRIPKYPREDDKLRASGRSVRRGGNAANSACALSAANRRPSTGQQQQQRRKISCSFLCTFPTIADARFAIEDFDAHGVDTSPCAYLGDCFAMPEAYILHSEATQSRTIVNYRDLPGISLDVFRVIPGCRWYHLEGNYVEEVVEIVRHLRRSVDPAVTISVEVEKPNREGIERLIPEADVVFFSRAFAIGRGWTEAEPFLRAMHVKAREGARLFVGWGEDGAAALHGDQYLFQKAPKIQVQETIGAGDSFIAGVILASVELELRRVDQVLEFATHFASAKCAQVGFQGIPMDF